MSWHEKGILSRIKSVQTPSRVIKWLECGRLRTGIFFDLFTANRYFWRRLFEMVLEQYWALIELLYGLDIRAGINFPMVP